MPAPKTESETHRLGGHALVIGGSIAGLLAARVLRDYFDRVTVVERDAIPQTPQPRKGVPQGHHVHAIFSGGVNVIERLFPGLFAELVADGAILCDTVKDLCWYHQGVWKLRTRFGSDIVLANPAVSRSAHSPPYPERPGHSLSR